SQFGLSQNPRKPSKTGPASRKGNVMTITNPLGRIRSQSNEPAISPLLVLTGSLAAVLTVTALTHQSLPADAFLPAVSVLLFVMSAAVALTAWRQPMPAREFSYWD